MTLNDIATNARFTAEQKGFTTELSGPDIDRKLLLAVSELCEAQNDLRDGYAPAEIYYEGEKPCGVPIELADAIIRICHLSKAVGIDIEEAVRIKMAFNTTRPNKHGRQF